MFNAVIANAVKLALEDKEKERKEILVTREIASKRLKKSYPTLWRWARDGYLVPVRIGRSVWYRKADIEMLVRGEITF